LTDECEVWFYHLERSGLDQTLPVLLEKTLARNWRALVRSPDAARLEHLDQALWSWRDDAFLPHGLADEALAEHQPVLLTRREDNLNDAQVLFLLDDAEPGELTAYERCIVLFDGRDEAALAAARKRWKSFKDGGAKVSYWKEDPDKGWEQQA
jgi:DNA polymerase-3 subunit chi